MCSRLSSWFSVFSVLFFSFGYGVMLVMLLLLLLVWLSSSWLSVNC